MAPADEKKKRTKKLVVEETSAEAPTEAVFSEEVSEVTVEPVEKSEDSESFDSAEDLGPVETETKKEEPQESILIPKVKERKEKVVIQNLETKDSKVSIFWVILLALFIIASLIGGGILVFRAGVEKGKLEATRTPNEAQSPTPTPSATAAAEVKREDLKAQVLNGTGKAGVAASAKDYLEGLGYKDVGTGNAETSDFEETVISIKDSKKDYVETLRKDLSAKYTVATVVKTISSGADFDAVITIGTSTK